MGGGCPSGTGKSTVQQTKSLSCVRTKIALFCPLQCTRRERPQRHGDPRESEIWKQAPSSAWVSSKDASHLFGTWQCLPQVSLQEQKAQNIWIQPWPVRLTWLGVVLQTEVSKVQFPVRAHVWGSVPVRERASGNRLMFLSFSSSLPYHFSRINKKKKQCFR